MLFGSTVFPFSPVAIILSRLSRITGFCLIFVPASYVEKKPLPDSWVLKVKFLQPIHIAFGGIRDLIVRRMSGQSLKNFCGASFRFIAPILGDVKERIHVENYLRHLAVGAFLDIDPKNPASQRDTLAITDTFRLLDQWKLLLRSSKNPDNKVANVIQNANNFLADSKSDLSKLEFGFRQHVLANVRAPKCWLITRHLFYREGLETKLSGFAFCPKTGEMVNAVVIHCLWLADDEVHPVQVRLFPDENFSDELDCFCDMANRALELKRGLPVVVDASFGPIPELIKCIRDLNINAVINVLFDHSSELPKGCHHATARTIRGDDDFARAAKRFWSEEFETALFGSTSTAKPDATILCSESFGEELKGGLWVSRVAGIEPLSQFAQENGDLVVGVPVSQRFGENSTFAKADSRKRFLWLSRYESVLNELGGHYQTGEISNRSPVNVARLGMLAMSAKVDIHGLEHALFLDGLVCEKPRTYNRHALLVLIARYIIGNLPVED